MQGVIAERWCGPLPPGRVELIAVSDQVAGMSHNRFGAPDLGGGGLPVKLHQQHTHSEAGDERHQPERDQSRAKGVQSRTYSAGISQKTQRRVIEIVPSPLPDGGGRITACHPY